MKIIHRLCCLLLLYFIPCASQHYHGKIITVKQISSTIISDSNTTEIFERAELHSIYGDTADHAQVREIAWSPDSKIIAFAMSDIFSGGNDDIIMVSINDHNLFSIGSLFSYRPGFYSLKWKDTNQFSFYAGNEIFVLDVPSRKIISRTGINQDSGCTYESAKGGYLLLCEDYETRIKSVDGKRATIDSNHAEGYAFSWDDKYLLTEEFGGSSSPSPILLTSLVDLKTVKLNFSFDPALSIMGSCNWHPNNRLFCVTDIHENLHIIDIKENTDKEFSVKSAWVFRAAWSPDAQKLALVMYDGIAKKYVVRMFDNKVFE
jgi:hypothetical protein